MGLTGATLYHERHPITTAAGLTGVIPARYADARIVLLDQQAPVAASVVREYLESFWTHAPHGRAPAFVGITESYKTTAAAIVARRVWLGARLPVVWVSCGTELPLIEAHWFRDGSGADRKVRMWQQAPFLVLDDITLARAGSRQAELLGTVIAARFDARLPTCWTGNARADALDAELAARFGAAITRRLLEGSAGFRIVT
jgi:DNA replication protein DnaC